MSESDQASPEVQRANRPWGRWTTGVVGLALVLLYVFSLLAYAEAGQSQVETGPDPVAVDQSGINFTFDLIAMDPAKSQMTLRMFIVPTGEFLNQQDASFAKPFRLTMRYLTSGQVTRDIPVGTPVGGLQDVNIFVDGNPNTYPFDQYQYGYVASEDYSSGVDLELVDPAPLISVTELGPDGQALDTVVPIGVFPSGGLQGWTESWHYSLSEESVGAAAAGDTLMLHLNVKRGGGVLAFVMVVMLMMGVTAILAGVVARAVVLKKRPIETTMAGWFAALLFALVPLRINLPGAPPIGAWIDVVVFFWVELVLLIAMAAFIGSWLKYRKPPS